MKKILLSVAFLFAALTGANAQIVLSQTSSEAPDDSTVACAVGQNPAVGISESSYFRAYTMDSDFSIGAVRLGVGSVTGDFPITVKLYTSASAFPASYPSGLTEIASATAVISDDQELTLVDVPVSVSVSSGDIVVVEIHNINTSAAQGGNGSVHYMGIATTESAPGYLLASGCQLTSPSTFGSIGFPEGRIIIDLVESTANTPDFASSTFSIYPNPVKDVLNISNSNGAEISSLTIVDINGRTVKQVNSNVSQINISDLNAGVYFVNINSTEGNLTKKIVKQ